MSFQITALGTPEECAQQLHAREATINDGFGERTLAFLLDVVDELPPTVENYGTVNRYVIEATGHRDQWYSTVNIAVKVMATPAPAAAHDTDQEVSSGQA